MSNEKYESVEIMENSYVSSIAIDDVENSYFVLSKSSNSEVSTITPFTSAAKTFRAKPSEIERAISIAVVSFSTCLIVPSGSVMSIIVKNLSKDKQTREN